MVVKEPFPWSKSPFLVTSSGYAEPPAGGPADCLPAPSANALPALGSPEPTPSPKPQTLGGATASRRPCAREVGFGGQRPASALQAQIVSYSRMMVVCLYSLQKSLCPGHALVGGGTCSGLRQGVFGSAGTHRPRPVFCFFWDRSFGKLNISCDVIVVNQLSHQVII